MASALNRIAILGLSLLLLGTASGAQRHREHGRQFSSPASAIYYEILGSAPGTPLVVVHGGTPYGHSYFHHSPALDSLADARRVIYYDQRGRARSPELKSGQPCTIADAVADLEALRAHLGLERMDLFAHSFGGFIALAFAASHPERVNRMILVGSVPPRGADFELNSPVMRDLFPGAVQELARLDAAVKSGDKAAFSDLIRHFASFTIHSQAMRDAFVGRLLPAPDFVFRKDPDEVLGPDSFRFDLTPELAKFAFPTLIVSGRWDPVTTVALAYRIQKAIPASRVIIFEQSGHFPFFEEPEAFNREVRKFLR